MKIALYFPSKSVGGSENLFFRLALILIGEGHQLSVIDFNDGYLVKELKRENVRFEHIVCDDRRGVTLPDGLELLLVNNFDFLELRKIRSNDHNMRLIVWEVHKCFYEFTKPAKKITSKIYSRLMGRILRHILKSNGLVVLENDAREILRQGHFKGLDDLPMVSIPVDVNSSVKRSHSRIGVKCVGSIGRAVDWKIIPTAEMFRALMESHHFERYVFLTDDADAAKTMWEKVSPRCLDRVEFVEGYHGAELDKYLLENVDIFIGMGTSVLEAGKLGIPSIIIDSGKDPYPQDASVRLLCHNGNDNLGTLEPKVGGEHTISSAVELITKEYSMYSDLTQEYVDNFHSYGKVYESFIAAAEESNLNFLGFLRSRLYRNLKLFLWLNQFRHFFKSRNLK